MQFATIFLFACCLLVSFLYSGIEAGLLSLSRKRLRSRIHQGDADAVRLGRLLARPGRLLATVLVVTNFADVAALVLVSNALIRRLGSWGCVLAGALMLPVYLILLQILPKSLFRRFPYRALAALGGLLEATFLVLSPLLAGGSWLLQRARLAPAPGPEGTSRTRIFAAREDLKSLAAEGERAGALTPAERGMIHNVIDYGNVRASDVMRPSPEPFPASDGFRVADLLEFARTRQVAEVPVLDAAGKPIALIDEFALLLDRDPSRPADAYWRRPPLLVTPDEPALRVLRRLRAGRLSAAAVYSPETGFVGIVRASDLMQRLVGAAREQR